ncbi:MAG TPA: response regulator [Verrucomicrobiae bacterium]|nr:response regulator [Verrucomicrobiae bacterium]
MNQQLLRVLVVEDSVDDTELMLRELRKGGFEPKYRRVETPHAASAALDKEEWDAVITDFIIPGFGGFDALALFKKKGLDIPFIVLSGQIGEEMAVRLMKAGAHDCIMKDNLARLVPALTRELREAAMRRERREGERALRESEERFRQLAENIDSAFFMFERASDGSCTRLLYASAAYEKIWGRSRESLYKDGRSWLKAVHPEDAAEVRKNLPMMERGKFNQEFRIIGLEDLKERWVHYRTFPVFNTNGDVYRIAGIAEDVTSRKAAEDQLAANQRQLAGLVEELKSIDEQLKESNETVWQTRKEIEQRVHERTAGLAVANAELQSQILARTRLEGDLIEMADRERRRRGMDTHAKLSQKLMGITFMLKALERKIQHKHLPHVTETRRIQDLINEVINYSDDLAQDFGSLELKTDDLARELKTFAANVRKSFQISCRFSAKGELPKLPQHTAAQLYKIAQDATGNAIKNGSATEIAFSLVSEPNCVRLVITDNGLPFMTGRNPGDGMSWRIMRSRASLIGGSLQIEPQEGQGMVVTCTVLLANDGTTWPAPPREYGEALGAIAKSC